MAVAALATGLVGAAPATTDESVAVSALQRCLHGDTGALPPPSSSDVPPGLLDGHDAAITVLPTRHLRAYSYEGTKRIVIDCGIAIYGRVPKALGAALTGLIERDARWRTSSPEAMADGAAATQRRDWEDVRAPGIMGVAVVRRHPNAAAPTLEIQYHRVLVS